MNNTICIDTVDALSKFVIEVDYLHDALLHELFLRHRGYVDQEKRMWGDTELPEARLVFQSQSPDFAAVQLNFTGISSFRLDPRIELGDLEVEFEGGDLVCYPSGKANADLSEIRAAHCEYRILGPEFLGSEYRLTLLLD